MKSAAKQFSFYGKTLSYDANRVEYNRLRHLFESFANKNKSKLLAEYLAFGGLDEFYDQCIDWIQPYFLECCEIAVAELVKLKYYGIDRDTYFEEVFDCAKISDVLDPIEKFYEELEEKKETRRESHSKRFHSGTHLRENYTDGSEAGLSLSVNMVGGAAALGVNAVASTFNFIADSCNKSDLYNNSCEPMISAILYCLSTAYWDLIEYARKNCDGFKVENLSRKDLDKASGIYKNLVSGKIPGKEQIECISEVLLLNPYIDGLYLHTLSEFGDAKFELQNIAEFFHIEGLEKLQTKMMHDYYKTLNLSSEEKAVSARKQMKEKAAYLGIEKYSTFTPLEVKIADYDLQYRTVCGIIYPSREEADAHKELHEYFKTLDFELSKSTALESREKLYQKAAELKISPEWLNPHIEYALKNIQKKAKAALEEFYKSLVIDSEDKAKATREVIARKAAELEIDDFKSYQPLEKLIDRYDLSFRTVGDKIFETRDEAVKQRMLWEVYHSEDYRNDEQTAIKMKEMLKNTAAENGIDGSWLIQRVETALTHFDEKARTRFNYRFASREEAQNALNDESVFFKAVWAHIAEFTKENSFIQCWNTIQDEKKAVITEALQSEETPFAYMHTTLLSSGKNGLAFIPSGLIWNSGSDLMLGIANNVVFKSIFKKKAQDMREQNQKVSTTVTWKEFFEGSGEFPMDEKNVITLADGKCFEAAHTKPEKFIELLKYIYAWKKEINFTFSGTPTLIPPKDDLHKAPEFTAMPAVEEKENAKVKQNSSDFPKDDTVIEKPVAPFPDNLILLQSAAKFRNTETELMVAPEIPEELYNNFIAELDESLQKKVKKETPICQADHSMLFKKGKKGFLLTSESLYYHNGSTEWMIKLSDIIEVDSDKKSLTVECADDQSFDIEGDGAEELGKMLKQLINWK